MKNQIYYCIEKTCNKKSSGPNKRCWDCWLTLRRTLPEVNGRYKTGKYSKNTIKQIFYCIEPGCKEKVCEEGRRCGHHANLLRFSNPKEIEKLKSRTPWNKLPRETRYCKCGCGETFQCMVTNNKRFILGHQNIGKIRHLTKETKEKIRQKHLGKILSEDHKRKIRENAKRGAECHNWNNGSSFEPYPLGWTRTFKEQIRYRDNYKCQICSVPEVEYYRKLDIHHIDYNKINLLLNNLITLCQSCHSKTNFNRDYWQKYFTNKVEIAIDAQRGNM